MNWFLDLSSPYPPPGTVVSVRAYLFYRHRGIVSDRWCGGKPTVICSSPLFGVIEQTWDEFRSGKQVDNEGYPGKLPYWEVVERTRSRIGAPYQILDFNCDHLKNYAHGLPVESEQVKVTVTLALVAGVFVAAMARK